MLLLPPLFAILLPTNLLRSTRIAEGSEQPPASAPGPASSASFLRDLTATNNIGAAGGQRRVNTYSATPPMAAPGSWATAAGLFLTLIAVSAGVSSTGGFPLLLSFAGVLAGSSLIFIGVRVANDDDLEEPIGRHLRVLVAGVRALVRCLRRNLGLAGLLLASTAVSETTVDRAAAPPVLSFCAFAVLLLGLSLLNVGVLLGEREQEPEH